MTATPRPTPDGMVPTGSTLMSDTSLFHEPDVARRSHYRSGRTAVSGLVSGFAAQVATGMAAMNAEKSGHLDDTDRRWGACMVAAQAGERTGYETLLRDCIPYIKRVARGQGVSSDCIDDVVQETLVTIHRARQTYDPSRSFTAWLRMIAQRRAIDELRRGGRTSGREVHAPLAYENHPDSGSDPEEAVSDHHRTALLGAALDKLPAKQREAVDHYALPKHSRAKAAAETGRTTGSLRVNWHRALKTLRTQLGGKD
jgi:RNA polymerase sigma-70 factor (ECF subfamily)